MHITVTVPHNIYSNGYALYIRDYVVTIYDVDPTVKLGAQYTTVVVDDPTGEVYHDLHQWLTMGSFGDYVQESLELAEFSNEFASLEE